MITRRTTIRLAAAADAGALADIYRPAVEGISSFETVAPDTREMASRVERTLARTPWLVCDNDGIVAGYAYATRHREREAYRWTVEVSAYVAPAFHRRGIGRALYRSLFAVLASQRYAGLVAGVALPNPASVALHEAVGFARLGVFHGVGFKAGHWVDVAWFERRIRGDGPPDEPIPLPELDASALEAGLAAGLERPS